MTLKILKDSKYKLLFKIVLGLIFISSITLLFLDIISVKLFNILWIPFWLIGLASDYYLYEKIGNLTLSEDNIEIRKLNEDNRKILHENIKQIKFFNRQNVFSVFKLAMVLDLNIILNDGKEEIIKVSYIAKDKPQFLSLLKSYYEKGINVKEFGANGDPRFLDESNLSYKQVQELKDKYKIIW